MEHLKLTHDKLSVEDISELVASPTCGAISVFMGTTRDNFEGKTVVNLEYEVYEAMAMKTLQDICLELRTQWPAIENIAIYHRLGTVPVKEASIVIAISSPHRGDAMQATQWCIDNVKKTVPIWKKEVYLENPPEWKENKESSTYPPRIRLFKLDTKPDVIVPFVPPQLIQIKADSEEIERRIQKFIQRKREEINESNIRDFCSGENNESSDSSCARVDAKLVKRKDSKGHLQVNRVLNTYHRDQGDLDYMKSYNPKNGIEERLQNIEIQFSLDKPVNKNIYYRLKNVEDRLLYLESISPEYMQFWDKNFYYRKASNKKRVFTIDEIDNFISQLEMKKAKTDAQVINAQVDEDNFSSNNTDKDE